MSGEANYVVKLTRGEVNVIARALEAYRAEQERIILAADPQHHPDTMPATQAEYGVADALLRRLA